MHELWCGGRINCQILHNMWYTRGLVAACGAGDADRRTSSYV
jgi:hypothetical protein